MNLTINWTNCDDRHERGMVDVSLLGFLGADFSPLGNKNKGFDSCKGVFFVLGRFFYIEIVRF
jgi:hypothetical protein